MSEHPPHGDSEHNLRESGVVYYDESKDERKKRLKKEAEEKKKREREEKEAEKEEIKSLKRELKETQTPRALEERYDNEQDVIAEKRKIIEEIALEENLSVDETPEELITVVHGPSEEDQEKIAKVRAYDQKEQARKNNRWFSKPFSKIGKVIGFVGLSVGTFFTFLKERGANIFGKGGFFDFVSDGKGLPKGGGGGGDHGGGDHGEHH